jgi:ectoine hydroxylase-related dioxygenase (phytanoyl-CoA dioxygenase family)
MSTITIPRLTAGGIEIDTTPEKFGFLLDSSDALTNLDELHAQMERDGYLFLPGFFERESVQRARLAICEIMARHGMVDMNYPVERAIAAPDCGSAKRPHIPNDPVCGKLIRDVIYGDKIMDFYSQFLGGPATHFDYTWIRTIAPGIGSYPHCDVIFMGRGTKNLYTSWVPFGDVSLEVGGLLLLEGSHHDEMTRRGYAAMDIDTACVNNGNISEVQAAGYPGYGAISVDFPSVRERIGGRLLTAPEFKMGDLLLFNVYLVHGSLDNQSKEIRLSTDSRYQLASEPLDERWIGENPPGHGGNSIRGMIC